MPALIAAPLLWHTATCAADHQGPRPILVRRTFQVQAPLRPHVVVLSNEYGTRPLVIGAAHVAVSSKGAAIEAGSDRALTFGGHTSITIPPGAPAISDPVDLTVAPFGSLAVSLFLPEATPTTTMHWEGVQTAYIAAGNKVSDADIKADSTTVSRLFLSEILVDAAPGARAIVTFGDLRCSTTSVPKSDAVTAPAVAPQRRCDGATVAPQRRCNGATEQA